MLPKLFNNNVCNFRVFRDKIDSVNAQERFTLLIGDFSPLPPPPFCDNSFERNLFFIFSKATFNYLKPKKNILFKEKMSKG